MDTMSGARKTSLDLLFAFLLVMELALGAMLCSNLGNENFGAGHVKCSRGPHLLAGRRFPTHELDKFYCNSNITLYVESGQSWMHSEIVPAELLPLMAK